MINLNTTLLGYDIHLSVTPSTAVDDMEPQFQQFSIESVSETETSDPEFPHTGNAEFDKLSQDYEQKKVRYQEIMQQVGGHNLQTMRYYGILSGMRYVLAGWYAQITSPIISPIMT